MENKSNKTEILKLQAKIAVNGIPPDLRLHLEGMLERLSRMTEASGYGLEYESVSHYLEWVVSLPWVAESPDNLDLSNARAVLDKNHYGMPKIKDRLLEYIAVLNLNRGKKKIGATVLCFVGLPGIGKTSVASSIAEALARPFIRIAMGGMGEVTQLRGLPRYLPGAEPGLIIRNLARVGVRNPVILLDEIDRVAEAGRASIMGVLLELLDPEQNNAFTDYFLGYPFDLSGALFICSGNNTGGISTAVIDRLEIIEMPAYTDEEKKVIGRDYLLPKGLRESGLDKEQITIADDLWPKIIRPLGYDAGIRTLDRTIHGICRKAARKIVESAGTESKFILNDTNIKDFLPSW
ncbi:MAG: AAA family ATPase [Patescibacteria group bacterium]